MSVLQALDSYYGRMAARNEVVAPGYSVEPIHLVVVLAPDGKVVDVQTRRDPTGKKGQPQRVPKWFGRSGNGSTPYFLWDNTAYALGVSNKEAGKTGRDHAAFRKLHLEQLVDAEDHGLLALRAFLESWSPDAFTSLWVDPKLVDGNVVFALNGELHFIHESAAAATAVERLRSTAVRRAEVFCLVTGDRLPPVQLHPKVKGVDGTASAEVPLVSFNQDSFTSYGKEQGANAPTSEAAAFRYGTALNRLLDRGTSSNRLKIGDATVAFWADASATEEAAARAAEAAFAGMMEPPTDAAEAVKVRDILETVRKGRPASSLQHEIADETRFHVLGLAPNAARLSVRFWLSDTFDAFATRLARHYEDLRVEPLPWKSLPSVQRLLVRTVAAQQDFKNIPPQLAGEVMRAVLGGMPYPRTLLAAAIMRLRAGDNPGFGWHAAAAKACINRSAHSSKEHLPVARDPANTSEAYQLGRLFYVLEAAQRAALGRGVNATITDRYYASASATPARVFGTLLRSLRNHVSDARKRGFGGWIDARVAEIISHLPPDLPKTLTLEDQGRFALGYYHERGTRPVKDETPDGDNQEDTDDAR